MFYDFRPMAEHDARMIVGWRYDGPYAIYDFSAEVADELLDPAMSYFAVDGDGELVGFFGYGPSGQVPGGHRADAYRDDALDVALGLRPDLTGRRLGQGFVEAGLAFGQEQIRPRAFRLSVLSSNQRAIRVYERVGFRAGPRFMSPVEGVEIEFLLMVKPVNSSDVE